MACVSWIFATFTPSPCTLYRICWGCVCSYLFWNLWLLTDISSRTHFRFEIPFSTQLVMQSAHCTLHMYTVHCPLTLIKSISVHWRHYPYAKCTSTTNSSTTLYCGCKVDLSRVIQRVLDFTKCIWENRENKGTFYKMFSTHIALRFQRVFFFFLP